MATNQEEVKFMVVGDSISHGREGDWTWRYRIWEWFRHEGIPARFVGPYKGTFPPDKPKPPRPPPLASERPHNDIPRSDGGYAHGISPDFLANSDHFSAGGRQAAQAKDLIFEQIDTYQPDFCLVQLGFNDLGWGVSGPEGTLASMKELVDQARSAKPDLKFAIANVPFRSLVPGFAELPAITGRYNKLLASAVAEWSTDQSPVAVVHFCENYSCVWNKFKGAYDGLHPNALGEYELAQAFSRTLIEAFSLGQNELSIPKDIPPRPTPTPTNFQAVAAPSGIVITWDAVYGAFWYDLRARLAGSPRDWSNHRLSCNRHDTMRCIAGQKWEYQVRACGGDTVMSPWTDVVSAVADPQTAPGPRNIVTHALARGFTISWDPPKGDYDIDRYGVWAFDNDAPGSFPSVIGVKDGGGAEIQGLTPGHRYGVAVDTWTSVGGGILANARSVVVARGVPPSPVSVRAGVVGRETVLLKWHGDTDSAAGFRVWFRHNDRQETGRQSISEYSSPNDTTKNQSKGGPILYCEIQSPREPQISNIRLLKQNITGLHPSVWAYEFAVSAFNGSDESPVSEWVRAPGGDNNEPVSVTGPTPCLDMSRSLNTGCKSEAELKMDLQEGDSLEINLELSLEREYGMESRIINHGYM